MQTAGAWLRQARESRGETLEQAAEATHIRLRFLEALEAWDLGAFPGGDVQTRGFLRIYARHLGLSADDALARYQSGARPAATKARVTPPPLTPPPSPVITSRPLWMRVETFIIAAIVLILLLTLGAGGWYLVGQKFGGGGQSPTVTSPASEAALYPTLTPAGAQPSPLITPTIPPNPEGGVTVTLEATEHVWARVIVDDVLAFEGMLAPEEVESWSGQELIIVSTGNGAGLQVTVNDQLLGALCGRGELCSRGWGPGGEVSVPALTP